MQPPRQHSSWVNLVEMKGQLVKKVGMERCKQYLDYLNRFLSLKLSKCEFDKLCLKTLGKDNIRLHNQLIRSVLKNVCTKVSSGIDDDVSRTVGKKKTLDRVYNQNGSARTGPRDRRVVDRNSEMVGPNGTTNNGYFSSSIPQDQEPIQQAENGDVSDVYRLEKPKSLDRTLLHAPLGIPFLPVSIGGAQRGLTSSNSSKRVLHTNGLLETETLKERMDQIASLHGLQTVSMDCANLLNRGLDAYLKRLVKSCTDLHGAGFTHDPTKGGSLNHMTQICPQENERKSKKVVTLLDFRVAMELNCKQLGENWPVLLEKICTHDDIEE